MLDAGRHIVCVVVVHTLPTNNKELTKPESQPDSSANYRCGLEFPPSQVGLLPLRKLARKPRLIVILCFVTGYFQMQ